MTGPRLLSSVCVATACVLLPTVLAAQYAPYPYGFAPGGTPYQAQPPYMEDPDDLYYSPRARLRPQQVRPSRGITSLPADADPDYSTTGASDEDVDFSETTRTTVLDPTGQSPGTLTIDTGRRKLYLSLGGGRALEYGIGVGRQGFAWKGEARVGRKAYWPGWTPPREMLARRPDLPSHMEGGLENPLGARALYLFQGNKDTLFRIHGTNEPDTIGKAVSSGCIRMLNADVIDLYQRVPKNARVTVI
jgi:lipoprotein-anchoring transpeptidase ErfK/SrfK